MNPLVEGVTIRKFQVGAEDALRPDLVAVEAPLEIRLDFGPPHDRRQHVLSVTMCTPGHDFELALGFLFTEGLIHARKDVTTIRYCHDHEGQRSENMVRVELASEVLFEPRHSQRNFYMTSSCGVCGKASIEALQVAAPVINSAITINQNVLLALPEQLRHAQAVFQHTGGLHAIGLFSTKGELRLVREDVGRHNAMDKVVGAAIQQQLPIQESVCLLSGRASFELLQKAVVAGCPVVAAIGAPSSLAIDVAEKMGVTLVGFLKSDSFNVYTHAYRIL